MDANHYNELITLSQEITDQATDKLTNYLSAHYCGVDTESMEQQMEDYLFVAEETSAYFLGNALALLDTDAREAEIHGADAVMLTVPYYNKASPEGLYRHFTYVSDHTGLPLIVYNVPGRTGANLEAETTLALARDVPNIVGIKEASGNFDQIKAILDGRPEGFSVLSGNDDDTLRLMQAGADGVISVASNVFPSAMVDFVRAIQAGRSDEAAAMDRYLHPLFKALFVEPNPIPAKAAMAQLGLMENSLRLPLVTATEETEQLLAKTLKELF